MSGAMRGVLSGLSNHLSGIFHNGGESWIKGLLKLNLCLVNERLNPNSNIWNKFDKEILGDISECRVVVLCIWSWVLFREQELHLLKEVDSEQEDLIPCQQLPHAVPFANTIWNNPLIFNEPATNFCMGQN